MFLGTARHWWITMGVLVVLGIGLTASDIGGGFGNIVGVLMVGAGIVVFAGAPMRYGDSARRTRRGTAQPSAAQAAAPAAVPAAKPAQPPRPVAPPYKPAQKIEAGDPSEV